MYLPGHIRTIPNMLVLTKIRYLSALISGCTESINYEDYITLLKLFKGLFDHKTHLTDYVKMHIYILVKI